MERTAFNDLVSWKNSPNRKPLLIQGARQVGKTWLMKEFGEKNYANCAYINFESSRTLQDIFRQDYDIDRILTALQIESGVRVQAEDTLIILDELQEVERGITSLKYFSENAPQYHVMAAGSLLGIGMHLQTSFPVGKIDFLKLYPMTYSEFLLAQNQSALLDLLQKNDWPLISAYRQKFTESLKMYYMVGGMPEAVSIYLASKDMAQVRAVQKNLLNAYELDFSKHAPADIIPRVRMLWTAIPAQLARENKKFIYGAVKHGSRARDFELALSWLVDAGLVYKIHRISRPGLPLISYRDFNAFKLFLLDVGLLAAMSNLELNTVLEGNSVFREFKGALAEQYVLLQLMAGSKTDICYWSSDTSSAEVDFVIQSEGRVIPIEVKAEENLQSKSLKSYHKQFSPARSVRTSLSDFRQESWLDNVPLYAIGNYSF